MRLLSCVLLLLPQTLSAQSAPRIEPADAPFAVPAELRDSIRFAWLVVPQNHDDPAAGTLRLALAIIAARTPQPAPDPIILIPGGPGDAHVATTTLAVARSPRVGLHRRHRAIIVLDPRGHGLSDPHACPELNDEAFVADSEARARFERLVAACGRASRAAGVRLDMLSSAQAARDLDVLRRALGVPRMNLIGASYGSRIATEAMRSVPHAVRSAMLHGPVPLSGVGEDTARAAVLRAVFRRCAEQPACSTAFPDLGRDFETVVARGAAAPLRVRAGSSEIVLDSALLRASMIELGYSRELAAGAPVLIHTAAERGLDVIASVVTQAVTRVVSPTIRQSTHVAFLCNDGTAASIMLPACRALLGEVTAPAADPFSSEIPALVMTGEFDPRTTPTDARRTADGLANSHLVIIPNYGHEGLPDCAFRVTDEFIRTPDRAPDTTCMDSVPPIRFVTDVVPSRWAARTAAAAAASPARVAIPAGLALLLLAWPFVAVPMRAFRRTRAETTGTDTTAWLVSAAGIALVIGVAAAGYAGARQSFLVPGIGVLREWSWVLLLPWLLLGLAVLSIALHVREQRTGGTLGAQVRVPAWCGAALLLGWWAVHSFG